MIRDDIVLLIMGILIVVLGIVSLILDFRIANWGFLFGLLFGIMITIHYYINMKKLKEQWIEQLK